MAFLGFKHVKTQDVVAWYTKDHLTLRQIARLTGMTHTGIHKRLRAAGVSAQDGEWVKTDCSFCGTPIRKRRKQWHRNNKNYCNQPCYIASLENPGYKPWRQGCRLARALVSQYFRLDPGMVVHHQDGDDRNNDLSNLRVYASQVDHTSIHRGGKTEPIWDGSKIPSKPPLFP